MGMAMESIVLGVVANAVTSVLAHVGRMTGALPLDDSKRLLRGRRRRLLSIIREATAHVSKLPSIDDERIREFVRSQEVETVARQLLSSSILQKDKDANLQLARDEFRRLMQLHVGGSASSLRKTSDGLFDMLLAGCDHALELAVEAGILAAHETRSALRHGALSNELKAIQRNLDLLSAPRTPDPHLISEFERKYRQQVSIRYRSLTPPDFDKVRRIPIDDLYVAPRFSFVPSQKGIAEETLPLEEFRNRIHRAVLLGDPGGGKSALAAKLSHDLAARFAERLLRNRQLTPLHVILRDYGAAKREQPLSILQFIAATAESDFQLASLPYAAFDYMLLNGHAVVILDGLDELLDTSFRQAITSDIELFCELYPSTPVLVTSRKVGYDQAPLDPQEFDVYHLSPFNEEETSQYVHKWFGLDEDLTAQQKRDKAAAFLEESRNAPDLRSNALMLALMCNIYRGEGYFPKNRPDVYEKCATMLFERWDKSRGIQYALPFEAHIRPIMMHLAHWIYTDEKRQGGVTESHLVEVSGDYLHGRRFEDTDEADHAARAFVQFCSGRAWVFTDTGTTSAGERLYQFTHRTFLEYFTAAYLVRVHRTPAALAKVLLPKIRRKEWDVVAQLAFQVQSKQFEGAGDELLGILLTSLASSRARSDMNITSFLVRCLGFMVPAPSVRAAIADAAVFRAIEWAKTEKADLLHQEQVRMTGQSRELVSDLCAVAAENRDSVANAMKNAIRERSGAEDRYDAFLALELGLGLGMLALGGAPSGFWRSVSDQIYDETTDHSNELMPRYLSLSVLAWWRDRVTIADVLRWHGLEGLMADVPCVMFGTHLLSSAAHLIRRAGFHEVDAHRIKSDLAMIGKELLSRSSPWIERDFQQGYFRVIFDEPGSETDQRTEAELLDLGHKALFGLFALMAANLEWAETSGGVESKRILRDMWGSNLPLFSLFSDTFNARYFPAEVGSIRSEIQQCDFTPSEASIVEGWARREILLVDPRLAAQPHKRSTRGRVRARRKKSSKS